MTRGTWIAAFLLLLAFLIVYVPDTGHGFVSDDFHWLLDAQRFLRAPSLAALTETTTFLRPLVTLSFALDLALFGRGAWAYGLTNLLLAVLCAALVYHVCRATQLTPAAALVGAGAWMFNFHGINMAVLWISGRTSLLLTFFALLAAWSILKRRPWCAALWCAGALFSKEEAIALPFILAAWVGVRAAWPLVLPLAAYFAVRLQTTAFWPQQAPDYYRFTMDLGEIATNAAHYLDRGGTVFAMAAIVMLVAARTRAHIRADDRNAVLRGLVWFGGGYALTVWVPVRSSLYAVFPSVGAALILGVLADRVCARLDRRAELRTAIALLALPFLLIPVYRTRNNRWVELADVTRAVLPDLEPHVDRMRARTPLWIRDDSSTRANIRNAFGGQMDYAVQFRYGVTPTIHVSGDAENPPSGAIVLTFRNGRLLEHR